MLDRLNYLLQRPNDKSEDKDGKRQPARRPSLVIELIPCTCGGQGQDPWNHSTSCPRGKAIRKRAGK
jgi:hypothetical protein